MSNAREKYGLNIGARGIIENLVAEIYKNFNIVEEPNIYDWTDVKMAMKQLGIEFEFDAKITEVQNSMLDTFVWISKEEFTLTYNVVYDDKKRTLQFEISEPNSDTDKRQYIKLLRTIFWELWDVLRPSSLITGSMVDLKADYSLFSRAMILPRDDFRKRVSEYYYSHDEKLPETYAFAKTLSVNHAEIIARMRDLDIIE